MIEKIINGIDDGCDSLLERAEYEEMRDDLLGDPEQLEEEVGFGEIMINQVMMVVIVVMLVVENKGRPGQDVGALGGDANGGEDGQVSLGGWSLFMFLVAQGVMVLYSA